MKTKRILLIGLGVLILLILGGCWVFLGPATREPEKNYFFVKTGTNAGSLRAALVQQGVLRSTSGFDLVGELLKFENIKPGRYPVKGGMSLLSLVRMLRNGAQKPVDFSITKLRTRESLASRIGRHFETDSAAMMRFLSNPDSLRSFSLDTNTVMAVVLPLTYSIRWNSTPAQIFENFRTAYTVFWNEQRKQKAEALGLTPIETITLASIVDEETNAPSDKPNIASTYLNRIRTGMPLQADPTVKFAMKNFALRRILNVHLKTPSPYNTYINRGLPPGPICTPLQATVDSVLNSPRTDYIYFVANSAMNGTHIFTSNYTDHMKYARLFQQELNKRNIH